MEYVILGLLGLCLGSFINALVWRLHEKRDWVSERSECVHCHHQLAWYDLLPVLSWLQLRGKCRYCSKPISAQYPLVELLTASLFVLSYAVWPFGYDVVGYSMLGLWLVSTVLLVALSVYDARWMILPDKLVFPLIAIGVVFSLLRWIGYNDLGVGEAIIQLLLGIASVAGLYYLLYAVSQHRWVGFGDVKLGIFMGAVLGWMGGIVSIMLANFIGLLVILPGLMSGKLSRTSKVPFGPFLIVGCYIALLFGERIISWYLGGLTLG